MAQLFVQTFTAKLTVRRGTQHHLVFLQLADCAEHPLRLIPDCSQESFFFFGRAGTGRSVQRERNPTLLINLHETAPKPRQDLAFEDDSVSLQQEMELRNLNRRVIEEYHFLGRKLLSPYDNPVRATRIMSVQHTQNPCNLTIFQSEARYCV